MAILATQTLVGNVGRVYDLRTVGKDNKSVIDFSMAITPRKRDASGEWSDGETYWINITAWGKLAENVAESFKSGDRIFVIGRTDMKPAYTNKDGEEVPARPIVIADFAGLEVSNHPAESKRERTGGGNGGGQRSSGGAQRSSAPAPRKEQAAAPKAAEKDIFQDDFDFGDDDGEGLPF